jgi:hypothetical protein
MAGQFFTGADTHSTDTNGNPSIFTWLITPIRPTWSIRSVVRTVTEEPDSPRSKETVRASNHSTRPAACSRLASGGDFALHQRKLRLESLRLSC